MKINICAANDPGDPKTWSKTPFNILAVLKKSDNVASAFAFSSNNFLNKVLLKIIKLIYNTTQGEERVRLIRYLNGERVIKKTKESLSNRTLHMGTLALPLQSVPADQFHYLFIDATWNIWSSNSTGNLYSNSIIKIAERMEKEAYNQVKHIFSISEYVKKNLINHYKIEDSKITVVGTGTGIIAPFFGEKDYTNKKILFAAKGRFTDKGGNLVLEAFKTALKINPSLHLSIVGQNEYTGKINHPNITTYGFLPVEELQNLFNTHSLFLMPAFNEPWGLVYIEAMLCKMPIVGLNRNSFPELCGHGKYGIGINKPDPQLLSEAILNFISNPSLMEKMGQEAQEFAINTFTWEKTTNIIFDQMQKDQ